NSEKTYEITDVLTEKTKEMFEKLAEIIEILSTQYAAAKKENGYDAPPVLHAERIKNTASIGDIFSLRLGAARAINEGMSRTVADENEEIDLGLLELKKKEVNPA
ncbi:MAG: hypothetical protein PHV05_13640, partial [Candidatus Riflebacteria bacterium]|nr:hypothetical protein [Candidatus Riflebacteria bacterium]